MNAGGAGDGTAALLGGHAQLGGYQLVREIARSNDIVWEAIDPEIKRHLAVKELFLPPNLTGEARRERIKRFEREGKAAGNLNHPNIVTIHTAGSDRGRYFIAMEYLEGQTLRDRLRVGGAMPLSEAVSITSALCDALEYAHARGIIHRDIKPDNIHILPNGQVKLTDFGIARMMGEDQLTVAGQVFGTPSYMSPEQIIGKAIDARSDLFSLGILLYEMVAGKKPFTGDSVVTITYHIMHDPIPPLPLGTPPQLEAVLRRATAKNPADRFSSAGEFRAALQAAVSGQTTGRTGAFAAAAINPPTGYGSQNAPQMTAQYGTQTQMAVAPGYAAGGAQPVVMPAAAQPVYPAPASAGGGRVAVAVAAALFMIAGALLGGAWIINKVNPKTDIATKTLPPVFPDAGGNGGNTGGTSSFPDLSGRVPIQDILKNTPVAVPSAAPATPSAQTTAPASYDPAAIQSARSYLEAAKSCAEKAATFKSQYDQAQTQINDAGGNQAVVSQQTTLRDSAYNQMNQWANQAVSNWKEAARVAPPGSPEAEQAGSHMFYKPGDAVDMPSLSL